MGYYRRYFVLYLSVALAAGFLWAAADLAWDLPLLFSFPLFVLVVFLAAIFCNVAGVRRYQQMNLRLLQTGDTQAFLRELSACEKAANRNTRNTIFIAKAYAYLLEGRYDAASALLTGLDLASCRQPRARQNDRCAYSVRCAGLAINCDQYQAAEQHLAALRREVAALRPTDALHVHYAKMLQDLSQMLAVRRGEAGGHAEYFRNQLEMAGDTVGRAGAAYYLARALLLEEGAQEQALEYFDYAAAAVPGLAVGRDAALRAAALRGTLHG